MDDNLQYIATLQIPVTSDKGKSRIGHRLRTPNWEPCNKRRITYLAHPNLRKQTYHNHSKAGHGILCLE